LLVEQGLLSAAEKCFKDAIELDPGYVEAYANLGKLQYQLGQVAAALENYNRAIQLNPADAELYFNRAKVLWASAQLKAAEENFSKAIELKTDYSEAYCNRGVLLSASGQFDQAVEDFDEAIRYAPDLAVAYSNRGNALSELGNTEAALASYDRAVQLNPDYANAFFNRGNLQTSTGLFDDARESFKRAIQINPEYAEAYYNRSCLEEYSQESDADIDFMETQIKRQDLADAELKYYYFALANAYERKQDFARHFALLLQGNRLRRKELDYNFASERDAFATIKALFTDIPDHVQPPLNADEPDLTPVFIVGMPRSGTSLVEQILASHSQVHGAGELARLRKIVMPIIRAAVREGRSNDRSDVRDDIGKVIRSDYLGYLKSLNLQEKFIIDKSPLNFVFLGFILSAIPSAKIIHVQRDPVAVCWSIFKHNFSGDANGYAYDMDELAEYYLLYEDLMEFWQTRFPGKFYHLDYEEMTENQEVETRKLLEFCGLDWEQRCLDFHSTKRAVKTASHVQVRKKMYRGSSSAWTRYEKQLQPLISRLAAAGYL